MENINENPTYLCGGVVFALITSVAYSKETPQFEPSDEHSDPETHANDPETTKKQKLYKEPVDHSDPQIMADFLMVLTNTPTPDPKAGKFRTATSDYKRSEKINFKQLPFNKSVLCNAFERIPAEDHQAIVTEMEKFIDKHINPQNIADFVKALLYIIKNDPEIDDADPFYITDSKIPVPKSELLHMTTFESSFFLVGIMHYILAYRTKGDNSDRLKKGRETLSILGNNLRNYRPLAINHLADLPSEHTIKVDHSDTNWILDLFNSEDKITSLGLENSSIVTLKKFKKDFEQLITSLIESDFECITFDADFKNELHHFCKTNWSPKVLFMITEEIETLILETIDTILSFSQFISSQYMRTYKTDSGDRLMIKDESFEEKRQLNNIVRPETQKLRTKLATQYQKICEIIQSYKDEEEAEI